MSADVELPTSEAIKILVVDDDPHALKLVKSILNRAYYSVVCSENVEEAVGFLDRYTFDCVVTDAVMPEIDGYRFVQKIRQNPRYAQIPILMLTRKSGAKDVKQAVDAGVTDYIIKPVDKPLLLDKIELCLKSKTNRITHEYAVTEDLPPVTVSIQCQLVSISELSLTLRSRIPLTADFDPQITTSLFKTIGIQPPLIKLSSCYPVEGLTQTVESSPKVYEAKFNLIGMPESDLIRLRHWIYRQEIRRRK